MHNETALEHLNINGRYPGKQCRYGCLVYHGAELKTGNFDSALYTAELHHASPLTLADNWKQQQ